MVSRLGNLRRRLLTGEADMLLVNRIGNLGGLTKEVEILAYGPRVQAGSVAEGIVIESIAGFLESVPQPIISLLKFESVPIVITT